MQITLSPVRGNTPRTLTRKGDTLIVDGEAFDFGFLQDGDMLPQAAVSGDWLHSDVVRVGGVLALTMGLPHGANAPHETLFPELVTVAKDGPIDLPPYDIEEIEA